MSYIVEVNHGSSSVCDQVLKYIGRDIALVSNLGLENWSYFEGYHMFFIPIYIEMFKICPCKIPGLSSSQNPNIWFLTQM